MGLLVRSGHDWNKLKNTVSITKVVGIVLLIKYWVGVVFNFVCTPTWGGNSVKKGAACCQIDRTKCKPVQDYVLYSVLSIRTACQKNKQLLRVQGIATHQNFDAWLCEFWLKHRVTIQRKRNKKPSSYIWCQHHISGIGCFIVCSFLPLVVAKLSFAISFPSLKMGWLWFRWAVWLLHLVPASFVFR